MHRVHFVLKPFVFVSFTFCSRLALHWCAGVWERFRSSDFADEVAGLLHGGEALILELVRVVVGVPGVLLKLVVLVVEEVVQLHQPGGVLGLSVLHTSKQVSELEQLILTGWGPKLA